MESEAARLQNCQHKTTVLLFYPALQALAATHAQSTLVQAMPLLAYTHRGQTS